MSTSVLPVLLTIDEIANHYGLSRDTINDWLKSGELVGFKLGVAWRVRLEDWTHFLEQRAQQRIDEIAQFDL